MKKLLIIPLMFILILSVASATITYDSTESNVITENIYGITTHNDNIILSTSTGQLRTLNYTLDLVSNCSTGKLLSNLASDGTYIYGKDTSPNPDRYYKINPTTCALISYQTMTIINPFQFVYNSVDGNFLVGTGHGLDIWNYDTNTVIKNIKYSELDSFYSDQYSTIVKIGGNFYVGIPNETLQIDAHYNIVQDVKAQTNTAPVFNAGKGSYFNSFIYGRTQTLTNDLYKYTTTGEETTNYVYVDGDFYSANQCIDTGSEYNYILCNDSYQVEFTNSVESYCTSTDYETSCEGVCVTTTQEINGSNYIRGACDPSDCTTECYTIGSSQSVGLTTYQICGAYDPDICLEYGEVLTCPSGEYYGLCTGVTCTNSYCVAYNYSSYNTTFLNSDWYTSVNEVSEVVDYSQVTPNTIINAYLAGMNLLTSYSPLVSDDNQYFKGKYLERAYNVHSALNIAILDVGIIYPDVTGGSGYASVICDHKETPLTESNDREDLNTTRTLITGVTGNIIQTSVTYTLNDTDDLKYVFNRVAPSLSHVVELNVTNQTMIVYSDGTIILNQTTADPVTLVNIMCDYDFSNLYRNCYVAISDGTNDYEVYETPVSFSGTSTPASTHISITPSDEIEITGYSVTSINSRDGFKAFNEGTYPFTCNIKEGGQIIRVYQNNGAVPNYLDYKDIYLNAELGTLTPTTDGTETDAILGGELTQTKKTIYAFLISLFIAIALFFVLSTENANPQTSGLIASAGLVGSLIIFTIIGWLPVVVTILMMILSAGIVAIVFRKAVMGA